MMETVNVPQFSSFRLPRGDLDRIPGRPIQRLHVVLGALRAWRQALQAGHDSQRLPATLRYADRLSAVQPQRAHRLRALYKPFSDEDVWSNYEHDDAAYDDFREHQEELQWERMEERDRH